MGRTVIIYTTGEPGSGKTYVRCAHFLLHEFLPNRSGVHWSNFPLGRVPRNFTPTPPRRGGETFRRRMAEYCAKREARVFARRGFLWRLLRVGRGSGPRTAAEFARRIRIIPERELQRWASGESGPWEYFRGKDLSGAHIALDECHVYIGRKTPAEVRARWEAWLGEIRHLGATVEFLSQHHMKVAKEVMYHAGMRYELEPADTLRDPYFKIPLGDWYELRAKFLTGQYDACFGVVEKKARGSNWRTVGTTVHRADPDLYDYYNSFSKPQLSAEGKGDARTEAHEYEKRTSLGLLLWFYGRHAWVVTSRFAVAAVVAWVCFFGGFGWLFRAVTGGFVRGLSEPAARAEGVPEGVGEADRGAGVGGDVPAAVAGEAGGVDPVVQVLRDQLAAERARAAMLDRAVRQSSAVVLLTRDAATFRGGYSYRAGEVIDYGMFEGRTVERIDYARRAVYLDDGTVLRMGRPVERVRGGPPDPDGGAELQGAVSGAEAVGPGERGGGGPGAAADVVGGVDAGRVFSPVGE